jgi:peptidoglycan/xylan/chitin deacetylase (PgdA/CDA1 family)
MYHADPADEGEPSSGFFHFYSFPVIVLSMLLASCHDSSKHEKVVESLVTKDTSKAPVKKQPAIVVAVKSQKKKKKIYLTFDDGPNKGTRNVLDIIQQEDVPVTFFIVGQHVFASIGQNQVWDSLKMAKNIELCNHSYTHAHNRYNKFYTNPETVIKDMEKTKETLLPDNNIVRAPGRNSWRIDSLHFTDIKKSKKAIDSLQQAGFVVFGWDLEWHYDPKTLTLNNTADELLNQIDSVFNHDKTKTKDNMVLLAHDQVYQKSTDSLQLRDFIQKIKKRDDYELALVNSYPGIVREKIDSLKIASAQ